MTVSPGGAVASIIARTLTSSQQQAHEGDQGQMGVVINAHRLGDMTRQQVVLESSVALPRPLDWAS